SAVEKRSDKYLPRKNSWDSAIGRGLNLDAGRGKKRARPRALIVGDRQPLGKLAAGRARGVDPHLGQRESLGVRRRVEDRALRSGDEKNVLVRPHPRVDGPDHSVAIE